jgi:hypothetical protein
MAQRAETLNYKLKPKELAPVVPRRHTELQKTRIGAFREQMLFLYRSTREGALRSYQSIQPQLRITICKMRTRLRNAKERKPLQIVGVVAATAFVVGISLRIWRSRAS